MEELRKHLERVKFHLRNLEIVMRLFTNEQLDSREVLNKLKVLVSAPRASNRFEKFRSRLRCT